MNKHLELLKSLVVRHPGLFDPAQQIDREGVIKDLRETIGKLDCAEIAEALTVKRLPAVVKWARADGREFALEIEGKLTTYYVPWQQEASTLKEGDAIEVDAKRTWYGTLDLLAVHLPAQAQAGAEAGA